MDDRGLKELGPRPLAGLFEVGPAQLGRQKGFVGRSFVLLRLAIRMKGLRKQGSWRREGGFGLSLCLGRRGFQFGLVLIQ